MKFPGKSNNFPVAIFFAVGILLQQCNNAEKSTNELSNGDSTFVQTLQSYSIQIAAMREKKNAQDLISALQKSEMPAYIFSEMSTAGDSLFKVRVGPFHNEKDADRFVDNLEKLGYEDVFIVLEHTDSTEIDDSKLDETGEKKQLTFEGSCSYPSWSPSNREIAFYKGNKETGGIYTIGTGGGKISKIVESDKTKRITKNFTWSPDGKRLIFTAIEVNKDLEYVENLFMINKNGSKLEKIVEQTHLPFEISNLNWSPDGSRIAFDANYSRSDSWSDLFQMVKVATLTKLRRPQVHDLTSTERINTVLGWKTKNELLFLAGYDDVDRLGYEIWSYDVNSRQRKALFRGSAVPEFREIVYLPSEEVLVYISFSSDKLLSIDLRTGEESIIFESQLSKGQGLSSIKSLDSKQIFFLSNKNLLRRDSDGKIMLTDLKLNSKFTVSPFGGKICFTENGDLFITRLDF